jgi:hypothetical protein
MVRQDRLIDWRLCDLLASDVDACFIDKGEGRWSCRFCLLQAF